MPLAGIEQKSTPITGASSIVRYKQPFLHREEIFKGGAHPALEAHLMLSWRG